MKQRRRARRNPTARVSIERLVLAMSAVSSAESREFVKRLQIAAAGAALTRDGWLPDDEAATQAMIQAVTDYRAMHRWPLREVLRRCGSPACMAAHTAIASHASYRADAESLADCAGFALDAWQQVIIETWNTTSELSLMAAMLASADEKTTRRALAYVARVSLSLLARRGSAVDRERIDLINSAMEPIDEDTSPRRLRTYLLRSPQIAEGLGGLSQIIGASDSVYAAPLANLATAGGVIWETIENPLQSKRNYGSHISALVQAGSVLQLGAKQIGIEDAAAVVRTDARFAPPEVMP